MSKNLWKNKKLWGIAGSVLTLTVVIAGGLWWKSLESQVTEGLRLKKFLPPTQFFAAPEIVSPEQYLRRSDLLQNLGRRKYRQKSWQERLQPGSFATASKEECAQFMASPLAPEVSECVLLNPAETGDPEIHDLGLELAAFNSEGQLLQTFQGNPLQPQPDLRLEPEVVAQFLEGQPIQQNYKPLGEIPVACLNAVLAIEDARFLEHSGVSYLGIARAFYHNIFGSHGSQGGSTITQQLVKNYFLTSERTFKRKAKEFAMSLMLENHSSKDEILETYLNIIYLGQNGPFQIRGFPAAAEYYFHKPIENLNTPECALLAAVLNSPGLYDPFHKAEKAKKRRDLVLDKMLEHNFINAQELAASQKEALPTFQQAKISETSPYYLATVAKELGALSIPQNGVKIFTGLNPEHQAAAQNAVQVQLNRLEKDVPSVQKIHKGGKSLEGVLISADNRTGLLSAIVGGRSFKFSQFNRATEAHRQVGSVMKPFVYLAAFESGKFKPTSLLQDKRFTYSYGNQSWSPENYGQEYFGEVPLYFALKSSLNCATASLGLEVGLDRIVGAAQAAGITSRLEALPSLTLGAFEITPMEVVQAYNTLSNFGELRSLRTVRAVVSAEGNLVYRSRDTRTPALPPGPTAELVGVMKQTLISGTGRQAVKFGFHHPASGKTGTTSDYRDSWFAGFTPQMTTVTWVGYDDNTPSGLTGGTGALPVWAAYMAQISSSLRERDFSWPSETKTIEVDDFKKPNDISESKKIVLVFLKDQEP
jgi:penicillin-binding protein 1B